MAVKLPVRSLIALGVAASGSAILAAGPSAGFVAVLATVVGGVCQNLFSGLLQPTVQASRDTPESIIRNHDIRMLVASAITDAIRLAASGRTSEDAARLTRLSKLAGDAWLSESAAADPALSAADEQAAAELFRTASIDFKSKRALSVPVWQAFLTQCADTHDIPEPLIDLAASSLHINLPQLLRGKVKQDFNAEGSAGGRGYASLHLSMLGGLLEGMDKLLADHERTASLQTELLEQLRSLNAAVPAAAQKQAKRIIDPRELSALRTLAQKIESLGPRIDKRLDAILSAIAAEGRRSEARDLHTHQRLRLALASIACLLLGTAATFTVVRLGFIDIGTKAEEAKDTVKRTGDTITGTQQEIKETQEAMARDLAELRSLYARDKPAAETSITLARLNARRAPSDTDVGATQKVSAHPTRTTPLFVTHEQDRAELRSALAAARKTLAGGDTWNAEKQLSEAFAQIEAAWRQQPFDRDTRLLLAEAALQVANANEQLGEDELARDWLVRASDLGSSEATDRRAASIELLAKSQTNPAVSEGYRRRAETLKDLARSQQKSRTIVVNCVDAEGNEAATEVIAADYFFGADPMEEQWATAEATRGATVPEETRAAFRRLYVIAQTHGVSFSDLCDYAFVSGPDARKAAAEPEPPKPATPPKPDPPPPKPSELPPEARAGTIPPPAAVSHASLFAAQCKCIPCNGEGGSERMVPTGKKRRVARNNRNGVTYEEEIHENRFVECAACKGRGLKQGSTLWALSSKAATSATDVIRTDPAWPSMKQKLTDALREPIEQFGMSAWSERLNEFAIPKLESGDLPPGSATLFVGKLQSARSDQAAGMPALRVSAGRANVVVLDPSVTHADRGDTVLVGGTVASTADPAKPNTITINGGFVVTGPADRPKPPAKKKPAR